MKAHRTHPITVFAMLALLAMLLTPATAGANPPAPVSVPPGENPLGVSYADWSAQWWTWALEQPVPTNPILDTTGANCAVAQSGDVWFLAGVFSGQATRTCTIPAGKYVYVPIVNNVYIVTPGNPPGDSIEAGMAVNAQTMATASNLHLKVDERPVAGLADYMVVSPGFQVALPMDNIAGLNHKTYKAVAQGVQVMLLPLAPGQHTIRFQGNIDYYPVSIDVTYYLTVVAP